MSRVCLSVFVCLFLFVVVVFADARGVRLGNMSNLPRSTIHQRAGSAAAAAYVPLLGSAHPLVSSAVVSDVKPDLNDELSVTILVRRQNQDLFSQHVNKIQSGEERHLTHEEFAARYGAARDDMDTVIAFASVNGLTLLEQNSERRTIRVSGTVSLVQQAFQVELIYYTLEDGSTHRGFQGEVQVPADLSGIIDDVLGLDSRPVASPRVKHVSSPAVYYTPPQVAAMYKFPTGQGSSGYNIAIIELGGGYRDTDLNTYWASIGISPAPTVVAVSVDGAKNAPTGRVNGPDAEVMLDVEIAGAIASQATIAVYFAPNSDAGFLDAITQAAHDTTYNPSVISISWGAGEYQWASRTLNSYDSALEAAAILGVTSFAASGDDGSSDGGTGNNVDFPAAAPHVTGCGGTTLHGSGGSITSEVVWDGSGGGVSVHFSLPDWQQGLHTTTSRGVTAPLAKRGVPDISGDADPNTGFAVRVDGSNIVVGGTSAVSPLWAALTAVSNAIQKKRFGLLNPLLYGNSQSLRDIVTGNNGGFEASVGWDATTGYGSINGTTLH